MRLQILLFFVLAIPVVYGQSISVDNIKVGMTLADVMQIHAKFTITKVANRYGNCADDIDFGYEIRKNNALIAFVVVGNSDKIQTMIVTSPKFKFDGINTRSTVRAVLKRHPNAKLATDSLDDWEYIHLQNPNITLGFETDEKNRIAIYDDETAVRIKRKNARVDFIKIQ